MPFMYCDTPKAIVQVQPFSIGTRSMPNALQELSVRLEGGVSFSVLDDTKGNGQEWLFSEHIRKTDHIKVCFGPVMPLGGADRYAIVGDVESGYFAYVLTVKAR